MTLKDTGRTMVFDARPPFRVVKSIDTGPITNHVNFISTKRGTFAYISVGGLDLVKVFRTDDFSQVASISVGRLPHGVWPSGDGSRVYVGLENDDALVQIDTATNAVVATVAIGQAPQAINYVPDAVPSGDGLAGLEPLGVAGRVSRITLDARAQAGQRTARKPPTSVSLFDQGLVQVLEAAVTGLLPASHYVLAFSDRSDGGGSLQPLASFVTNAAGAAIVNAIGPIRQVVESGEGSSRRYLVIAPADASGPGTPVQIQTP
jgi:YVTN family beta-propeller protein